MPLTDLTTYIGARIRIEKSGHVHEGVLKGVNDLPSVAASADGSDVTILRWILHTDADELHFSPADWTVTPL